MVGRAVAVELAGEDGNGVDGHDAAVEVFEFQQPFGEQAATIRTAADAAERQMRDEFAVLAAEAQGVQGLFNVSLQSFDLIRSGAWGRALTNIVLSVILCVAAVAAGHRLAQHSTPDIAIAETDEEEYTG